VETAGQIRLGKVLLNLRDVRVDLRPAIQKHLRKLAAQELPARVLELASRHGIEILRVSIRNQKSRWGSCSRSGAISLNWRLIQTPDFVRDYIILHELAHRRQMNHSGQFWLEVERLCPDYWTAERWIKGHSKVLR
jgi:predicted metal-dependent hydrolase